MKSYDELVAQLFFGYKLTHQDVGYHGYKLLILDLVHTLNQIETHALLTSNLQNIQIGTKQCGLILCSFMTDIAAKS